MRRQTRPFTVEVKRKRGYQKRGASIWGDLDFSSAVAETTGIVEEKDLQNRRLIDSNVIPLDAEYPHKPQPEHFMADPLDARSSELATEPAAKAETPGKKGPRPRKSNADSKAPARKNAVNSPSQVEKAPAAGRTGRKVHSDKERSQKLSQIEKSISGGATLKSAVKQVGISEQTYYHWKKVARGPDGDDLKDLLALEEENKRLKSLLAQRLRKENAELKKKLGLN